VQVRFQPIKVGAKLLPMPWGQVDVHAGHLAGHEVVKVVLHRHLQDGPRMPTGSHEQRLQLTHRLEENSAIPWVAERKADVHKGLQPPCYSAAQERRPAGRLAPPGPQT
jgi:hypothetical protein